MVVVKLVKMIVWGYFLPNIKPNLKNACTKLICKNISIQALKNCKQILCLVVRKSKMKFILEMVHLSSKNYLTLFIINWKLP